MKKISYRIISLIIMITLFSCLVSHAWLSSKWDSTSDHTVSFKSGNVEAPKLTIWTYDQSEDVKGWTVYYTDASEEKEIETVVVTDGKLSQTDGRLQFGMITSLVEETNENDIYFRFDIDGELYTEQHYDAIEIDYHYIDRYVDVYQQDNDNSLVNDAGLYSALVANDLIKEFYVTSDEKYDDASDIIALFDDDSDVLSNGSAKEEVTMENGDFYLYLKLTINRENLREVLDQLNDYMPCYLVFNVYVGVQPIKNLT